MSTAVSMASSTLEQPLGDGEKRLDTRRPIACDLWMIDHYGSTVLRCRCLEMSRTGMRLRVPLGYGVAEGQRYELRSHLPGAEARNSLGLIGSRWATVVRTQMCLDGNDDHLDVGVVLDAAGTLTSLPVS